MCSQGGCRRDFSTLQGGALAEQKHRGGEGKGEEREEEVGPPKCLPQKPHIFFCKIIEHPSQFRPPDAFKTAPHVVPRRQSKSTTPSSSKVDESLRTSTQLLNHNLFKLVYFIVLLIFRCLHKRLT